MVYLSYMSLFKIIVQTNENKKAHLITLQIYEVVLLQQVLNFCSIFF